MKLFKNALLMLILAFFAGSIASASTQKSLEGELLSAIENGDLKAVKAHIAAGANVDATTNILGTTVLMKACSYGHAEVAKALILAGANVNAVKTEGGETALMLTKNPEIIKALIAAGADVDATDDLGETALMHTLRDGGPIDTIRVIMAAKPNIGIRNKRGLTAVELAEAIAEHNDDYNPLVVNIINDPQGDLDDQLAHAVQYGNTETVKDLIAAGANVNAKRRYTGDTALMLAAKFGRTDIVKILLAAGADVDATNEYYGETALMKAVEFLSRPEQCSNIYSVKALLAAKANIDATNRYGKTALELATKKGRDDIVKAIKKSKAKLNSTVPEYAQ